MPQSSPHLRSLTGRASGPAITKTRRGMEPLANGFSPYPISANRPDIVAMCQMVGVLADAF